MKHKHAIGVDIGGSSIKVMTKKDEKLIQEIIPLPSQKNIDEILKVLLAIKVKYRGDGMGFVIAGLLNRETQTIEHSPNLKFFENIALNKTFTDKLGIPCVFENDAAGAALGEFSYGAGKDSKILLCLTLGTGLGGGLILNGELYRGTNGCALEPGHTIIQPGGKKCSCGRMGCMEAYVSSYAIEDAYGEITMTEKTSAEIIDAVYAKNAAAMQVLSDFSDYLTIGAMNLVHLFNPDSLILAGGIVEHFPELVEILKEKLQLLSYPLPFSSLTIKKADLGQYSGAAGALSLIENKLNRVF